ncbi:MAG TPA: polysaccharide biosynthesis/export family protein [Tepidisphaeraceae bacterium]|jgi:protein involved in polysaccharide export with SLBB domain|nr:polysaccharide biosynthesis/export family protein [Tepidisphaeraceae bacterium]
MRHVTAAIVLLVSAAVSLAKDAPLAQGDLVAINVHELLAPDGELSETRQVAPDGTIRVPMLGPLKFGGLTPDEARDMLKKTMVDGKITARPQVRVALLAPAAKAPEKPGALKAGDQLVVRIFELVKPGEDYVGTLTVSPAGEIDVPSIGGVKVAGQRADEIEKTLIARLAGVLATPEKLVRVDRAANAKVPAPDGAD